MNKYRLLILSFFVFNVVSLINVLLLMGYAIGFENIMGFIALGLMISGIFVIAIEGKYFVFLRSIMAFNILAVVYMLYAVINRSAEGWNDIASILAFIIVFALGLVFSVGLELWQRRKKNAS